VLNWQREVTEGIYPRSQSVFSWLLDFFGGTGGLEISPVDEGQCQAFVNTVMNV
jgi:hypothetical protein